MIKSIMMKNCATYSSEGASIDNCQKVNFFYGPNGSGKSTIGNYLHNPENPIYSQCKITWEHDDPIDIFVYNRDFRAQHFKENIAGIFTLGKATIEQIEALNTLKAKRDLLAAEYNKRKDSLAKKQQEKKACIDDFREKVWNEILKKNENDFKDAFTGYRTNKEKFREQILSRFRNKSVSTETRDSLISRANTLFSSKPEKCELFSVSIVEHINEITSIQEDPIWSVIIVGNKDVPIAKLIDKLGNADWVNKGRQYITSDNVCPFCQEDTLNDELKNQLNAFFSGEYEANIEKLKNLINRYSFLTQQVLISIDTALQNQAGIAVSKLDVERYNSLRTAIAAVYSETLAVMNSKLIEPGKKITFFDNPSSIQDLLLLINDANELIESHNIMVDNYTEERKKLVDDIWIFLINYNIHIFTEFQKKLSSIEKAENGIQRGIDCASNKLKEINRKIVTDGKNITSVQPAVDEINRSLRAYGFTNFQIVPSLSQENSYQIQRLDGTLATHTLSEGEETFISFLYFLQYAKGSEDVSKYSTHKILVLDDPICSLDSTILYIVSSMVKTLIKDVRDGSSNVDQIFILTHNVFFHKEASFIDGRTHELNDVHYWIISKENNITNIRAFEKINPIKSSYELLWQELKSSTSLVTIQNTMRRILENYFTLLGTGIDDKIINSFETLEEKMICRSLISWINDGSHTIPDDLYIDSYTDSIDRYKEVFKSIFVNMRHEAHYEMMMGYH